MGRLRKHLGDLCLQASLPGEAILHYQTALDLLRTVNDFLWMGGERLSSVCVCDWGVKYLPVYVWMVCVWGGGGGGRWPCWGRVGGYKS